MTDAEKTLCRLVFTEAALSETGPAGWRHVADFLMGLLARKPFADSSGPVSGAASGWNAERWILGSLATELAFMAREAGISDPDAPMVFGADPVERARALVEDMAQAKEALDRQHERDAGQGAARSRRLQERWAADMSSSSGSDDLSEVLG